MTSLASPQQTRISVTWVRPNWSDESKRRLHLLQKCKTDPGFRALVKAMCAVDVVYFVNNFAWTYDPRRPAGERVIPWVLFPSQEEYLRGLRFCLRHKLRSLTKKSRDMGVTWLNGVFDLHGFLHEDGYKAAVGSRKEDLVDRGEDPDTIFWKLRFMLKRLPWWFLPKGWQTAHMRLFNPENGASITGESGANIGRGGRSTRYTIDESAFLADPEAADSALSENTDCRNDTSTVNGPGNPFARTAEREDGVDWAGEDATPTDAPIVIFTLHWRDHPEKTEEWYAKKCASIGDPVIIARELDIDFSASVVGVVVPRGWVLPCIGRDLYPDERNAICIGADIGEASDPSAAVVREGLNIHHIEEWHGEDPRMSALKLIALGLEWEKRIPASHKLYFFVDKIGIGSGTVANLRAYVNDPTNGKQDRWVVVAVDAASTDHTEATCHRLKDALWWRMRAWFQAGVSLLADGKTGKGPAISRAIAKALVNKLAAELGSPTYSPNDSGKVVVESKKKLAKRGIKSPNIADALMHTFFREAMKPVEKTAPKWMEAEMPGYGARIS